MTPNQTLVLSFEIELNLKTSWVNEFKMQVFQIILEIIELLTQNNFTWDESKSKIRILLLKSSIILKYIEFLKDFKSWIEDENLKFDVDGEQIGLDQILSSDFSEFYIISKLSKPEKIWIKILEYYLKFISASALTSNDHEQMLISALQQASKYTRSIEYFDSDPEIVKLFLSDWFSVCLFHVKIHYGKDRTRNRSFWQKYDELLSNIDHWFIDLLMNKDTYFHSEMLTKIWISLVKNFSYESYHRLTLTNLLKLSEDIYLMKDKVTKDELEIMLSIWSNISVYIHVLFNLSDNAVWEFINSSASKLSMHLSLVFPKIPLIEDPPNNFIGEIKMICSKLLRLLERLIKSQTADSFTDQHIRWCKEAFFILISITENYFEWLITEKANLERILDSLSVILITKYSNAELKDYEFIESVFKLSLKLWGWTLLPSIKSAISRSDITFK